MTHTKLLIISSLIFTIATFFSCNSTEQETISSTISIPKLLDRNEAIQHGKEWENIQNQYASNRKKAQDTQAPEALLNLAHVFINEARITGEHGHYYPSALHVLGQLFLQKSIDKDLQFRALTTKAGVLLSLHQFDKALKIGKKALQLNTYNAQIYGVLVDAHVELGNYDEAVKMADKMVSIRPDLRSYSRVSYLREIHGDVNGAIEAMKMAVAAGHPMYEESAWTRLTLGQLHESYGDKKQAEMQYQIILQNRPDYPFAIAALGNLAAQQGESEKAERLLKQAIDIIQR